MKNIIVTGASKGIGFELVKLFTENNYNVLAISRNTETLKKIAAKNLAILSVDLSNQNDISKINSFVNKNWSQVDVLIHNAGKLSNKPFAKTTTQDFIDVYQVNVFAVAELTRQLIPYLKEGSHVVTISSMGGIQGSMKFAGLSAYSSSKGAVITLCELLAEEYKELGISFNTLALGAVQTEMLAEAFPDFKAPVSAKEMGTYIYNFALTAHKYYNGKVLEVSSTTP